MNAQVRLLTRYEGSARPTRRGGLRAARAALVALMLGLCWPQPSQAALFEDEDARRAIIDLRARINEQGRTIDALRSQIDEIQRSLDERIGQRVDPALRGNLDLQNQLEVMRQELAKLRGQIELQANELATTQRRQRDLYADVDSRVKRFEPTQVQIDGKTVSMDPVERRGYESALALFRAGDFRGAQNAFQAFVTQYPDSAYLPNSLFWIGSAQFALKDYKAAIATHEAFLAKHADHPRAPDAMLNLAYAQIESNDRKTARKTLETVVARYGDSPAAQAAKDRLSSLK
jgi:tol-pal system protein YbgF